MRVSAMELSSEFRWCRANWTVRYPQTTDDARELALKRFDRTRYPIRPQRDLYLEANTWGSGDDQPSSVRQAREGDFASARITASRA